MRKCFKWNEDEGSDKGGEKREQIKRGERYQPQRTKEEIRGKITDAVGFGRDGAIERERRGDLRGV